MVLWVSKANCKGIFKSSDSFGTGIDKNSHQERLNGEGVPTLPLEGLQSIHQERDGILNLKKWRNLTQSTKIDKEKKGSREKVFEALSRLPLKHFFVPSGARTTSKHCST